MMVSMKARGLITLQRQRLSIDMFIRLMSWILFILMAGSLVARAQVEPDFIVVGQFSAASPGDMLPSGWKPLTFEKINQHTKYSLVNDSGRVVVKAASVQSASGIAKEIKIDPKIYPIIEWEWKIGNILNKGNVHSKDGDDYAARIYVTFAYDRDRVGLLDQAKYEALRIVLGEYPPLGAITYIWGNRAPEETMVPNTYSDEVVMVVVRSGSKNLNTWLKERRNIYQDYQKAFGIDPPLISGVAIMTDTDNTRESATALFGDIIFRKK